MSWYDVPVRRMKRRTRVRIEQRQAICGYKLAEGLLCSGAPVFPGQPCYLHTPVPKQAYGKFYRFKGGTALRNMSAFLTALRNNLSQEEVDRLTALHGSTDQVETLQDNENLLKLQILRLQRDYQQFTVTQEQYDKRMATLQVQLTKNTEVLIKAQLAKEQLGKNRPDRFGEDAFDPTANYKEQG